jgi:hypothetical protein
MSYFKHKWRSWQFKRKRRAIQKCVAVKLEQLNAMRKPDPYDYAAIQSDEYYENQMLEEAMSAYRSSYLIDEALEYDVEIPSSQSREEFWQYTEDGEKWFLNRNGRDYLEDLVNKKKELRAAGWVRFAKVFVPIVGAAAALLGAITGFIVVLHHAR